MKKFLMMAFVSLALMATTSCSKDDDKEKEEAPTSLVGTLWEANIAYNDVPMLGSGSIEVQLYFKSEELCRVDANLPPMVQMALSAMGINSLEPGEYPYTFDGEKMVLTVNGSIIEMEYTGNTLVFQIPEQYNAITTYLGGSEVVFYKQ